MSNTAVQYSDEYFDRYLQNSNEVSKEEIEDRRLERAFQKKIMEILYACALLFATMFLGSMLLLSAQSKANEIRSNIAKSQQNISIAKSENVRLKAELARKVSANEIEDYAENILGMVKAENYQINYIDLSEGDKIIVSGGKSIE